MGKLGAVWIFACQGLASRRGEALLMGLTFIVVFCSSASAVGTIRSGRREILANMQRLGRDIIQIHKALSFTGLFKDPLGRDDVAACGAATGGTATGARVVIAAVAAPDGRSLSSMLVQTDAAWPAVNGSTFLEGRFFGAQEQNACVLDVWLARELFGSPHAVGREVLASFGGVRKAFTVAGVIADPLAIRERFQNLDVLKHARHPFLRLLESKNLYVPDGALAPGNEVSLCLVKLPAGADPRAGVRALRRAFGARADQLMFWARGPWIDGLVEAFDVLRAFSNVVWLIFVLLTAGMVMTLSGLFISGRMPELAVRRTQGASRDAILAQILLEGLLLQGGGAVIGTALSPLAGAWICRHLPWPFMLTWQDFVMILGAGLATTLGALLLPALRAVRREPMEALRQP